MIEPASMALLLLSWPIALNLLSIIKTKSKRTFYTISIGSTTGMALATFFYGPVTEPIRISNWVVFSLDKPSWLFIILIYMCWAMTLVYCMGYISAQFSQKAETFHRFMSATLGLSIGAGMADNFFTLLVFYFAAIPTIVPLISLRDNEASRQAARFYVLSTLWPMLLLALPAIVFNFPLDVPFEQIHITKFGWSHERSALVLAMIIIGLSKNCIAPFHLWLPRSSIAPAPVTALIHSVAAVQVASIALLKIAKHVYGFELLSDMCNHFWETGWLLYLCGGTAIYTALRAWRTPNLKERFSFSTVGQLSYIITAILIGTEHSVQGAMLHIVTHSIAKLNLFFCAGAYLTSFGSVQAPRVADAIPGQRWLGVTAVISGLSIAGFPLLAGYYSKDIMLLEEIHRQHYSAAAFLLIGSLLNFVYIFPLIRATLRRATSTTPAPGPLPLPMKIAILLCTGMVIALSVFVYSVMRYTEI
ncbi:MAG: proton-conducting transporter membrane subunit [Pirellulales bacterium]|nr:proton-conducting transporter membrane subunit [Pirellulales bacterium]